MNKKKWQKPELIVLVKGKPEESVLTSNCKQVSSGAWPSPTGGTGQTCKVVKGQCGACQGEGGGGS